MDGALLVVGLEKLKADMIEMIHTVPPLATALSCGSDWR